VANYGSPGYLKEHLSSVVPKNEPESVMEVLLAPNELSFNQQSEKELLECVLEAKSKINLEELIKIHAARWHWLDNSYYQSRRLSPAYFLQKIKTLPKKQAQKKLAEIKKYPQTLKAKKAAVIKKFKLPAKISKLAEILAFSIW